MTPLRQGFQKWTSATDCRHGFFVIGFVIVFIYIRHKIMSIFCIVNITYLYHRLCCEIKLFVWNESFHTLIIKSTCTRLHIIYASLYRLNYKNIYKESVLFFELIHTGPNEIRSKSGQILYTNLDQIYLHVFSKGLG